MPLDPQTSDLLRKLGGAAIEREREAQEPFPPKWDPSNPDHPNPLEMVAFPGLRKPERASSPLIEATHKDGRRFTIWANYNLLTVLSREGVQEGQPCAIRRSSEKKTYFSERLGHDVDAWQWTVVTPLTLENPSGRSGRLISMAEATRLLEGVEAVTEAKPELIPDAVEAPVEDSDDDGIPF